MQATGVTTKTVYFRGGSYAPAAVADCDAAPCAISLGSSDSNETWSYYPPDGVWSASITGGSTKHGTGLFSLFDMDGATNITIVGLALHDFDFAAIWQPGGTVALTVTNNEIYNQYDAIDDNSGAVSCYGGTCLILNNYIHNIAYFGTSIVNVNGNISGSEVSGNYFQDICTGIADCGAIYFLDIAATATNLSATNNYIRDGNISAALGSNSGSAIYADDCLSNFTATGNVIAGRNGSNTMHVHGGSNVHYNGNVIDLATLRQKAVAYQTSSLSGCKTGTMSGNQFEHNVVISGNGGGGFILLSGSPKNKPAITDNDYFNYAGSTISHSGTYTDSNPSAENPQLNCWEYDVAAGSPILSSPVGFPGLSASWGPSSFVLPETGTPPSSPHAC